jgi:predicted peptidase
MNKLIPILLLLIAPSLTACETAEVDVDEEDSSHLEPSPVPTSSYQTGVHLQGIYELPDWLRGLEPIESEMKYLLYLPDGYGQDPEKMWPLIVFLHGSGDDDFDSAWVMSTGLPEVLLNDEQPENFEFVVVSPQSFFSTTWWDRVTPTVVNALVDEVISSYQIVPSQVYLTGLSMGGYGAWYIAAANPDRYAALASISGSGYRTTTIPSEDVMCQIEDIPVWAIHGSLDQISNPNANRIYLEAYEEMCDGEVNITFYPEEGHFGAYYRAYRDPALYDWFLSKTKPAKDTNPTVDNEDHTN